MVLIDRTVMVIAAIASFHFVSDTEQHRKWYKPYAWDGPPKYLHSIVIKSPSPSLPIYLPPEEKPFKSANTCDLRKVVFTQSSDSPQVNIYEKPLPNITLYYWPLGNNGV